MQSARLLAGGDRVCSGRLLSTAVGAGRRSLKSVWFLENSDLPSETVVAASLIQTCFLPAQWLCLLLGA